jgi:hypothetical protein
VADEPDRRNDVVAGSVRLKRLDHEVGMGIVPALELKPD